MTRNPVQPPQRARPSRSNRSLSMMVAVASLMLAGLLALAALVPAANAGTSVFNVRDYGAVGDGLADDTAAIQAAIDQAARVGGSVYVPSGTYIVSQQGANPYALRLASGITVYGDGSASLIKLAPNQDRWTRVLSGSGISNVVLRDFAVDGSDDQQATWSEQRHGVFISRASNVTCQRLLVRNTSGDGIFYYGGSSGLIENCTAIGGAILENARVGINFQGANGLVVRNNTVTGYDTSYKAEIDSGAPDATDIQILNNRASGGHPLALNGSSTGGKCRRFVIQGNNFSARSGVDWNIWVGHAYDVVIRNNTLSGAHDGVYVIFDAHNVTIEGNRFQDQRVGVQLSNYQGVGASDGISVIANTFRTANPVVNVSAAYSNVEVAFNGYPAGATLVANPSLVTGLSVHDNVVGEALNPATTTTTAPASTTTTTVAPSTTTTTTAAPVTTTTAATPSSTTTTTQAPATTTTIPPTTTTTVLQPEAGTQSQEPAPVTAPNPAPDSAAQVTFLQPADQASVYGKTLVKIGVSSSQPIAKVRLYADGRPLRVDYRAPWVFAWNTRWLPAGGAHTLTAVAYDFLGNELAETSITVYVGKRKTVAAASTAPEESVLVSDTLGPSDSNAPTYLPAMSLLWTAGIVSGYPDGSFRPENNITRAQFAKMLANSLGVADTWTQVTRFTDLGTPDSDLYPHRYVAALEELGILKGKSTSQFVPAGYLSRAQAIMAIVRALAILDPSVEGTAPAYLAGTSVDISLELFAALATAEQHGLLEGIAGYGPQWNPWLPATRGEVSQMLVNILAL